MSFRDAYNHKHDEMRRARIEEFGHLMRPRQPLPGTGKSWPMTEESRRHARRECYAWRNLEKMRTYAHLSGLHWNFGQYAETYGEAINRAVAIRCTRDLYDQAMIITEPVDPREEYRRAYRIARKWLGSSAWWVSYSSLGNARASAAEAAMKECAYIGVLKEVAEKAISSELNNSRYHPRTSAIWSYSDYLNRWLRMKKAGNVVRKLPIP